jgi:hypothetical protein
MGMENEDSSKKEAKRIEKVIEEKIDEFVDETFPASDPPAWGSLRRLDNKAKKLKTQT